MIKYFISGISLYLLIGGGLFLAQRRLTFNRSGTPKKPEYYGLTNVSEVYIKVSKNLRLLAWFINAKNHKPTIVYFHGNSFDIGERAFRIKNYIDEGYGILLCAYRGFSGNLGSPSEKYLYLDSIKVVNWLKEKHYIEDNKIVLYGESLGTAVAIELAQKKYFKAIILESPFTSLSDIAQKMYPIYPVKYLILDKFDNLSKINNLYSPLLVLHGKNDEVVPFKMGQIIFNKYQNVKENVFIDEAMHNNLYDYGIARKVIEFINKH